MKNLKICDKSCYLIPTAGLAALITELNDAPKCPYTDMEIAVKHSGSYYHTQEDLVALAHALHVKQLKAPEVESMVSPGPFFMQST